MSDSRTIIDPDELWRRRVEAELSQAELAERAGVGQSHISKIERGHRGADPKTAGAIARALGCKIADLMPKKIAA
jgi:transcriptional regulator with XRE-family HTH domain